MELVSDTEEDTTLLDLTGHIASKWPNLLDGTYEDRLAILQKLNQTANAVLAKKSRRLQRLMPEAHNLMDIESDRKRKRL